MRELRSEIRRLKRDYQSLRYPGDLANVLPPPAPQPALRIGGWLAVAAAAAAAIAASVWVLLPSRTAAPVVVEIETPRVAPAAPPVHEPAIVIEQVANRTEATTATIENFAGEAVVRERTIHSDSLVEAPFVVQMPAARFESVSVPSFSVPSWSDMPGDASLSTEWIAMPQPMLSVPNVSEIDATLVSAEPAS